MKRTTRKTDELRPDYDLTQLKGCVRGKYVERARQGSNIILLDKDVADVFKDDKAVNEALRTLIRLNRKKERLAA
ncbi:MAG TPA: hypothetical protein VF795_07480 [Desulfuromonadaceae bacterium]